VFPARRKIDRGIEPKFRYNTCVGALIRLRAGGHESQGKERMEVGARHYEN
jgi:hypothetical protein